MSLATSFRGPGGGGAGVPALMAPRTNAVARAAPRMAHENIKAIPGNASMAPPINLNAIAADLLDKNQQLTVKSIKNMASYPIVAIDLYGDDGVEVAYYPPRNEPENKVTIVSAQDTVDRKLAFKVVNKIQPSASGKNGNTLVFQKEHEQTYKILRKMIKNGVGVPMLTSTLLDPIAATEHDCVVIPKPQHVLGARSYSNLHPVIKESLNTVGITEQESTPAIAEESSPESRVSILNGSLDGSTTVSNNAFDRALFQIKLKSDKKALTFLPEELVSILIAKCKKACDEVWEKEGNKMEDKASKKSQKTSADEANDGDGDDEDEKNSEESYLDYPPAIAVPAWAMYDEHMEALQEACDKNVGSVFYQRSVAAMVGALVSRRVCKKIGHGEVVDDVEIPKLVDKLMRKYTSRNNKVVDHRPIVIVCGLTDVGIEMTVIQLDQINTQGGIDSPSIDAQCPFRDFKILATVGMRHINPITAVNEALSTLVEKIYSVLPELFKTDGGGIDALVTYGSITKQLALKEALTTSLRSIDGTFSSVWNDQIDFFSCREDAVVIGTSILAAISHERIIMAPTQSSDHNKKASGKKDLIVKPAIEVHNVSTTRLLLSINSGGKESGSKILFDYDQRVPSTSLRIEFSAAECVALMKDISLWDKPEKLHEESQQYLGSKYVGLRDEAARDISFSVCQVIDRAGHQVTVGNPSYPLRADKDGDVVSVESSYVEFKVNSMGMLTQCMVSSS